jgi:hypothetical protein
MLLLVKTLLTTLPGAQRLNTASFWHQIGAGRLHVGRAQAAPSPAAVPDSCEAASLIANGYARLPDVALPHLDALCGAIDALRAHGLPAQFVLVFDEAWEIIDRVESFVRAALPDAPLANIGDYYVFDVQPGEAGWGAHRDREGGHGHFDQLTGLPNYLTCWVLSARSWPRTFADCRS